MNVQRFEGKSIRLGALLLGILAVLTSALSWPTQTAAAQPAPTTFRPVSSSWPDPQQGYVLGSEPCKQQASCTRLLTTSDGGQHWQQRTAPDVAVDNGNPPIITAVDDRTLFVARFVDHAGKLLKSTDGGRTWQRIRIATPSGQQILEIDRIVVHRSSVYALISTVAADGSGDNRATVYTMASSGNRLTPRRGLSVTSAMPTGDISSRGGVLQVVLGSYGEGSRYWYSFFGRRFRSAPSPCAADQQAVLGGITVDRPRPVAACVGPSGTPRPGHAPKHLAAADRVGGGFVAVGAPAPTAGAPAGFAQPTTTDATFAAAGGDLIFLYATSDAGRHWKAVFSEPGFAPNDLNFSSPSVGTFVALGVSAQENRLYRTTDGGTSWKKINFSD